MQLDDLQIFVSTIEHRSFTAAAEALGLSKQYVSRRIGALEDELGVRLLNRTTRRLQATDLGMALYERAQSILAAVHETEEMLCSHSATVRGALRVSAPVTFGTLHLGPLVPRFMQMHPHVEVTLDLSDRHIDLIAEGYDMALRGGILADSSLVARRLALVCMEVVAAPSYLAQRPAPGHPDELGQHECLLYGQGGPVEWLFKIDGKPARVAVKGRLHTNNGEIVRDAALAGMGIACLPDFIIAQAVADGRLIHLLEPFQPPIAGVHAVYPKHRQPSRAVQAFTDFLRQELSGMNTP
ncbi:LysR family transcriptional regulator [Verticiella sediminum]|uniref:LysR family transcriptional regulator n=1 Tax=Verticiella sediminum TaxID=1247510 RepID=UPI001B864AD9|nr:LysR family transcriptional regulator [Verticiella sediminum]